MARPSLNGTDIMYCQLLLNDVGLFLYFARGEFLKLLCFGVSQKRADSSEEVLPPSS